MYALNATSQVFIVISFESIRNKNMEKKNLHLVTQILTWMMKPGKAAAIVSSLISLIIALEGLRYRNHKTIFR